MREPRTAFGRTVATLGRIDEVLTLPELPPLALPPAPFHALQRAAGDPVLGQVDGCPPRPIEPPVALQQHIVPGLSPQQVNAAVNVRNAMVQRRNALPWWLRWLAW